MKVGEENHINQFDQNVNIGILWDVSSNETGENLEKWHLVYAQTGSILEKELVTQSWLEQ